MNIGKRIRDGVFLLGMSLFVSGCTRPGSSANGVSLQLAIPQPSSSQPLSQQERATMRRFAENQTAYETTYVQVIILNVTGPGITSPVYYQWQNPNHSGTPATPPGSVTLTVPVGNSRLIQALVVSQGSQSGVMSFNYGDATVDLSGDTTSVNLTTASLNGTNSGQGSITGRYLNAAGSGPTGAINVLFSPPGKPAMLIQQGEIFAGYFHIFGLQGVGFTYQAADGTTLFSNASVAGTTSNSLLNTANSHATAMVSFPPTYGYQNCGQIGCTGSPQFNNEAQINIVGYFGPGVTANTNVFFDALPPTPLPDIYTDTNADVMTWQTVPAVNANSSAAGLVTGGYQITGVSALASEAYGNPYVNYLYYNLKSASDVSQALGFKGPYANVSAAGNYPSFLNFANSPDGKGLMVSWQYAPGATAGLSASEVFYLNQSGNSNGDQPYRDNTKDDAFLCSQLVSNFGFTSAGQVNASLAAQSAVIPGHTMSDNLEVIVCPIASSGQYYETAVDGQSGNYGNGGGSQLYMKWQAATPSVSGNYTFDTLTSVCQQYTLTVVDSTGTAQTVSSAVPLSVDDVFNGSSGLRFYSDLDTAACNGNTNPTLPITIAAGSSSANVWVNASQLTSSAMEAVSVCANCTGGAQNGIYIQYLTFPFAVVKTSQSNYLHTGLSFIDSGSGGTLANEPMSTGTCYPISLETFMSTASSPSIYGTSTAPAPQFTVTATSGSFFSDSNCSVPLPNNKYSFSATDALGVIYYMATVPAASVTISASVTAGSNMVTNPFTNLTTAVGPNVASKVVMTSGSQGFYAPGCNYLSFGMVNSVGAPVNSGSATISTLHLTNGTLYAVPAGANYGGTTDPNWCTTAGSSLGNAATNIAIGSSGNNNQYYFVATSPASMVSLSESDSLGGANVPLNLYSNNLYIAWASASASTPNFTQAQNSCAAYKMSLMQADGTVIPMSQFPMISLGLQTGSGNGITFHANNAACSGSGGNMVAINFGSSGGADFGTVSISTASESFQGVALNFYASAYSTSGLPINVLASTYPMNILGNASQNANKVKLGFLNATMPSSSTALLVAGSNDYCYAMTAELDGSPGTPVGPLLASTGTISFGSLTGYTLYSNPLCLGTPLSGANLSFGPQDSIEMLYLKVSNVGATGTLTPSTTGTSQADTIGVAVGDSTVGRMTASLSDTGYSYCEALQLNNYADLLGASLLMQDVQFSSLQTSIIAGADNLFPYTASMGNNCSLGGGSSSINVALSQGPTSTYVPGLPFVAVTPGAHVVVLNNSFGNGNNSITAFMQGYYFFPQLNPVAQYYPVRYFTNNPGGATGSETTNVIPSSINVLVNQCQAFNIYFTDPGQTAALNDTPQNLGIDTSGFTGAFYSDSSCAAPLSHTGTVYQATVPASVEGVTVYFKATAITGGLQPMSIIPSSGNITGANILVEVDNP